MAVIINMNIPEACNSCPMEMQRCGVWWCAITGYDTYGVGKPDYCPLKSADDYIPREKINEMIAEIIDKSWNIDMYDSDLDFECSYLSDVLSIIHKYCDKEQEHD